MTKYSIYVIITLSHNPNTNSSEKLYLEKDVSLFSICSLRVLGLCDNNERFTFCASLFGAHFLFLDGKYSACRFIGNIYLTVYKQEERKNKMKKIIYSVLVFAFVVALFLIPTVNASADETDFSDYTKISTKEELDAVRNNLSGKYVLTKDIVFTEADFAEGGAFYNDGKGWTPIGTQLTPFVGIFDGDGHKVDGLYINTKSTYQGLFGYAKNSIIKNVGLVNSNIIGAYGVGSVVGRICAKGTDKSSTVLNCYNIGNVSGCENAVGGVVG